MASSSRYIAYLNNIQDFISNNANVTYATLPSILYYSFNKIYNIRYRGSFSIGTQKQFSYEIYCSVKKRDSKK